MRGSLHDDRVAGTTRWPERDRILWSPALSERGVVAGFTTRGLGSMGGRATPPEEASANRAALAARLGFDDVVRVKQVHGDRVLYAPFVRPAPASPVPAGHLSEAPEADAMWTDRPGVLLGIVAADCVPILIADDAGRIGAAHAGWDGTTREVARRLVQALRDDGADPTRMVAALGPSIGPCCYTIGEERASLIRERGGSGPGAVVERDGSFVFDLWRANAFQLGAEGVRSIEIAGVCTKCGGSDLWSYRGRDEGQTGTGLGLGFIGRRP
jgi:YfiH family protein